MSGKTPWTEGQDREFLLAIIATNNVTPNWDLLREAFPKRTKEGLR